MGLHTGEPVLGGADYVGLDVHRAARICAAGHGGQVLISRATRELVADDLSPDVVLKDLGEHRLKDLDRPEHLFQLVVGGLPPGLPASAVAVARARRRRRRAAAVAEPDGRPRATTSARSPPGCAPATCGC